jgi:hypothetical protein
MSIYYFCHLLAHSTVPINIQEFHNSAHKLMISKFFSFLAEVEPSPLVMRPFIGFLYQPWIIDDYDDSAAIGGMNGREIKALRENLPSATLATINPTVYLPWY